MTDYIEKVLNKPFVSVFSTPDDRLWQRPDIKSKDELIVRSNETCLNHVLFKIGSEGDLRPLRPKQFFLNGKKLYYADACQGDTFEGMMDLPFTVIEFIEPKPKKEVDDDYVDVVAPILKKNSGHMSLRQKTDPIDEQIRAESQTIKKEAPRDDLLFEVMGRKLHQSTMLKQENLSVQHKTGQELYTIRFFRARKFTEIGTYQPEIYFAFKDRLKRVCINTCLLKSFRINRKLCWDSYSRSCVGTDLETGEEIFIRTIEKDSFAKSSRTADYLKSQIESMRLLDSSPRVSKLYYVFEDVSYVHLVLSFCGGPRLEESLKLKPQFKEGDLRGFCSELMLGIEYLHSRQIVHGNISPDTIIMKNTGKPSATNLGKITSFKNLTSVAKGPPPFPLISKPGFIAPEILNSTETELLKLNYYKTDIFSLGAVIYYMMTGYPPFKGASTTEILEANKAGNMVKMSASQFQGYSEQWVNLIMSMLDPSPDTRPTTSDCLRVLQVQSHLNLFATAESNRPKLNHKKLLNNSNHVNPILTRKTVQLSDKLRETIFTSVFCTSKFTYDNQYPVLIDSRNNGAKTEATQATNKMMHTSAVNDKSFMLSQPPGHLSAASPPRAQTARVDLAAASIAWNSAYGGVRMTEEPERLSEEMPHSEPLPKSLRLIPRKSLMAGHKLALDHRKEILSENSTPQKVPSLPQGIGFSIKQLNQKLSVSEKKAHEINRLFIVPAREIDKARLKIRKSPSPKKLKDLE